MAGPLPPPEPASGLAPGSAGHEKAKRSAPTPPRLCLLTDASAPRLPASPPGPGSAFLFRHRPLLPARAWVPQGTGLSLGRTLPAQVGPAGADVDLDVDLLRPVCFWSSRESTGGLGARNEAAAIVSLPQPELSPNACPAAGARASSCGIWLRRGVWMIIAWERNKLQITRHGQRGARRLRSGSGETSQDIFPEAQDLAKPLPDALFALIFKVGGMSKAVSSAVSGSWISTHPQESETKARHFVHPISMSPTQREMSVPPQYRVLRKYTFLRAERTFWKQ